MPGMMARKKERIEAAYGGRYPGASSCSARHSGKQGYTGSKATEAAEEHNITIEIVRRPQTKRGFVLLP